ncbi:hypothetical protein SLEP1_g7392 [Rubroshorea leprosula]|uniref:Uncharacterized protein n=1 Tax=Rubroshorea leprosula TaxID=152421 RepID=A0AAV5I696_9ROSI|nr:hypothetical protein SLEP1_g7392 [Rubroshorea leprosula]
MQEEETTTITRSSPRAVHRSPSVSPNTNKANNIDGVGPENCHSLEAREAGEALQLKDSARERLKRHREEVAGRVPVPDKWGNEELLKDWMDHSSFDALLAPKGLELARQALMAEGRRMDPYHHQRLRIESMC